MAKNKQRLSFEANLSRHPHDISAGYTASMSTGAIIPQWFDVAQPGDKYIFKTTMFARLQNISKAFLGEIDLHVKYFFVPLSMLYTPFGQIFAQTNDVLSSFLRGLQSVDTFPMYDVDARIDSTPNNGFYTGHKECYGKECARLLDAFNLNPYAVLSSQQRTYTQFDPSKSEYTPIDLMQTHNPKISPWILGAYQAIYQKFFRNDEQEKFIISAYNFDYHFQDASFDDADFFKLRYCQRPADYFTKLRVSPIVSFINKLNSEDAGIGNITNGDGGELGSVLAKVSDFLGSTPYTQREPDSVRFNMNSENNVTHNPTGFNIGSPILGEDDSSPLYNNVANIRAAFALDKFLRVYGRAGKTYDEQILAHFGIKIPHDVKHDATEICHFHNVIQADPVYGTATIGTDNASVLGQVGGQAAGTLTGSEQKFVAPVHGVVMAVAYAVTKPRYYGTFSKLHLLGSRIDFPIPEYDKLGAQPMYNFEINPHALVNNEGEGGFTLKTDRMGWQNRYQQFKEKYNRLSFTYAPANAFGETQDASNYSGENEFMPWVLSRKVFDTISSGSERTPYAYELWESPLALNPIMDIPLAPDWSNDYYYAPHLMFQTDPILTEFYCDCTKVSWMSPTGEPDL